MISQQGWLNRMKRRILVVDDMELNRDHLRKVLEIDGFEVEAVADGRAAWDELQVNKYHLVITDMRMPELSGLELLARVRAERLPVGMVVLTAFGEPAEALRAMKAGADDFITKPYDPDQIRFLVKRILDRRELIDELEQLRKQPGESYQFHRMVSKSPKLRKVFELIEQVGPLGSTVLIQGETGTGKELVARALHAADPRRSGPFVALNCAVLNDALLESELFGHERGAFTGAERRKMGRFEQADGGTLLLDEAGDIPPALQAKLLRVLQTGRFERVGGTETIQVQVRIIAASHKILEEEVKKGRFRADLFYRLNVIRIDLPTLRERTEDIPLLALHFLQQYRSRGGTAVTEIAPDAMEALLRHTWPGNIRELENAIKAGVALADSSVLRRNDLPESVAPRHDTPAHGSSLIDIDRPLPDLTCELIGQVEREYFVRLLSQYKGNVARCARHSGLSRRSVTQKLQKYGLERTRFKGPRPESGRPTGLNPKGLATLEPSS
jgi:DNA-binding NtrC family response regulator